MPFNFNADQPFFDRIFPFTVIFDKDLKIIQVGRSMGKLFPGILGSDFNDLFKVSRPRSAGADFESFRLFTEQIFILEGQLKDKQLLLRGEMCLLSDDRMAYFCSPWLTTPDDLEKFDLNIGDYALHDAVTDMLQLIKVKDVTNNDIQTLNRMLKGSESRLSNLIRTMQTGILLEDESRRIILSNQFFCDIFNIPAHPDQMVGLDCSESAEQSKHLFTDPEGFVKRVQELIERRELHTGEELYMQDGRYFERDFIPIYQEGRYMGHLWQYRDLTEQKRAREELLKAKKEAESAREAEKEFISHMSHEIRTPLNSIIGMSHLLQDTELTPQQREYLEIQKSSTEILYGLINDILDISKIESGNLETSVEKLDLADILRKQFQTFLHQLKDRPIELKLQIDESLNEYLMGDKVLLNQVLFNLLGNASKFTEAGTIELKGKVLENTGPYRMVCLSVKDTGMGIPKNKQEEIFRKFKQADSQVSVKYGGTGLGLAITKKIVDLIGGTITVDSKTGEGSNFRVFLPLFSTGEQISKPVVIKDTRKKHMDFKGRRFLVAEDNDMNVYYIRKILESTNAYAVYAKNGREACDLAAASQYDLILMDLMMPEMGGLDATVAIRSSAGPNTDTPIIALTASVFKDQVKKASRSGMNAFLSKPFTPDQLFDKLTSLLDVTGINDHQSSKEQDNENGIDPRFIHELYGGDMEVASEILDMFLTKNYPLFEQIGECLRTENYKLAREYVHTVKPSLSMIGLPDLQDAMNLLEEQCEDRSKEAAAHYQSIRKSLETSLPHVQELLKGTS